jgi:hypothetical protein
LSRDALAALGTELALGAGALLVAALLGRE